MLLTFLEGIGRAKRLVKTFSKQEDGRIAKSAYPNARRVTSFTEEVIGIVGFTEALRTHAKEGRALFTSSFSRPLYKESRSGMASDAQKLPWLCLDFDGAPYDTVEDFISEVPYLSGVSYVVAYSASQGFKEGLNAHVFFLLDEPAYYSDLKVLLTGINWFTDSLRSAFTLSDSQMAVHKPLDTAAVRKASLIYLAPPVLEGGPDDPFASLEDRIFAVRKEHDMLNIARFPETWRDLAFFAHDLDAYTDELRAALGLEPLRKRRMTRNEDGFDVQFLQVPPNTKISKAPGALHENGAVRCNVNNGDSAAYYFRFGIITEDTLMFNFKEEDPFLLAAADPEFTRAWNDWYISQKQNALELPEWLSNYVTEEVEADEEDDYVPDDTPAILEVKDDMAPSIVTPGVIHQDGHFIFRDRLQDEHFEYRRRRDGTVSLSPLKLTSAKTQAKVLGIKFNKEKGFPTMTLVHDVTDNRPIYQEHGEMFVNTYTSPAVISFLPDDKRDLSPEQAVELMKERTPAYYQTIHQAMGSDDKATAHFMNWLSVLFTKPEARVNTAWLLRGVHGSGKSSLAETMLHMMVNYGREALDDSVHVVDMALSISSFDDWRYGKKIVLVDEVEVTATQRTQGGQLVYNWYKTLVSSPRATLNKKGARLDNVKLNTGYLFASNYHDRFYVDPTERRYHVPPFQNKKMIEGVPLAASCSSWTEFKEKYVAAEVPMFGEILSRLQASERMAQQLFDCGDFAMIADASRTTLDSFAVWLKEGNFDALTANIFDAVDSDVSLAKRPAVEHAMRYVAYVAATNGGESNRMPASVAQSLYQALAPSSNISTNALTRRLQQLGVAYVGAQRVAPGLHDAIGGSRTARSYTVEWGHKSDYAAALGHPMIRQYVADMGVKEGARNAANVVSQSLH